MNLEQLYHSLPEALLPLLVPAGVLVSGICLSLAVTYIVSLWLVYAKAGRAGCLVLLPFVNAYVLLRIAGLPIWTCLLLFVPPVNLLLLALMWWRLGRAFGRGTWFGLGLIALHPLFVLILAFGTAEYQRIEQRKPQLHPLQPMNIRPDQA